MSNQSKIFITIGIILAAVAAWYFFLRKKTIIQPSETDIKNLSDYILKNDPAWKAAIEERARNNNQTFETRLRLEVVDSLTKSLNK